MGLDMAQEAQEALVRMNPSDLCIGDAEACLDTEVIITPITASIIAATTVVVAEEFVSSPFLSEALPPSSPSKA